jgi:cytochrome b
LASGARRIWDAPTRAFHWLLVILIAASWGTAKLSDTLMGWHLLLGDFTLGLIVFRILWAIVGTRHARIWNFLRGPVETLRYARSLVRGHVETPGHNPMGGWMVLVMLALIAFQVATGLFANDEIAYSGPWSHAVSRHLVKTLTAWHTVNVNLIIAAIALHLIAIAIYRFGFKTDLVGPMITGRKSETRVDADAAIAGTPWLRFLVVATLAGAAAWAIVNLAPPEPPGAYDSFN